MQASNRAKECGICNEDFDEELHCPRILPCTHCLCTRCINQLIYKNAKECPFCRQHFEAMSARDFGRNNNLLDLLQYINELEGNPQQPHRSPAAVCPMRTYGDIVCDSLESCSRAEEHIKNAIRTNADLRTNLLMENRKILINVVDAVNVLMAENDKKVEDLCKENETLQRQWREVTTRKNRMMSGDAKVDPPYDPTGMASPSADEVTDPLMDLQIWLNDFVSFISAYEDKQEWIRMAALKIRSKANAVQETLNSEVGGKAFDLPDLKSLNLTGDTSRLIPVESLLEMSGSVMQMVSNGMLFAVQLYEGRRRSARIYFTDDNKLCVSHLANVELPLKASFIKHSDMMKLVNSSPRRAFLELAAQGSTLGRMIIHLTPETRLGDHFICLCTGEMGPSYVKTGIVDIIKKGHEKKEIVQFGDYEKNDGTGGRAVMSGLSNEFGEHYKRTWLAGTVGGWWWGWRGDAVAAQFLINTRDNRKIDCEPVIGMVEEGLEVLTKALSRHLQSAISISDCGMMLPSPNFSQSAPPLY